MMFSSSPLDKSCINSDSCSPGRNNPPNRLSVAVPVRDDNQQFRIQLAIHKYNGTAGSPLNSRCSFMSPVRHSFLKNSLKVRTYEGDSEGTSKTEKRNGNQYEGVGAFPTVHLKKSAVRYRPIKRFHDVKIPYPELPVNRFLSHLPEVCPDLKSSTRSVLDVLEDLSGNKIHSKDDSGSGKPKPRGLGGDFLLNPSSVYKPLFVQKPKLNSVLTRDNTTQTISPVTVETPSPQSSSSSSRNGVSDPRAELRRKLAKQNNEIFASLSSSISSNFTLKRKIDKVLPGKDDGQLNDGSAQKKTKVVDHLSHEYHENGLAKSVGSPKVSSSESVKLSRKSKLNETNSVSPNKDRLTTIFLDTRNTSPKAQVFQAKASAEAIGAEKSLQKRANGPAETNGQDNSESGSACEKCKDGSGQSSVSLNASGKAALSGAGQQEPGQSDKPAVNFLMSRADTSPIETVKPSSGILQPPTADTSSSQGLMSASGASEIGKSTPNGSESGKKENENRDLSKAFSYGNSNDKPNFGSFKFGADVSTPVAQTKSLTGSSSETVSVATTTPQFSFGTTSNVAALQTSRVQFAVTTAQSTPAAPAKTAFTFGQSTSPSQQTSKNTSSEGKPETSIATPTPTTATAQSNQPVAFTFGQKPSAGSASSDGVGSASQTSNGVSFGASFGKSPPNAAQTSGGLFAFGAKAESSATAAPPVEGQSKPFPFSFGQKPGAEQSKTQGESEEKGKNLFLSEPKAATQLPTQESSASTSSSQPATTSAQVTVAQSSAPQTSTSFGAKPEGGSLGSVPAPAFNAPNSTFPTKTISFGSSVTDFGKTTSQTANGFATSTTAASAFSFGTSTTTQAIPTFGIPPATQSPPTFGSSTPQSAFGNSSALQSAPAFGASTSQSTPSFAAPPTTQPTPTFGVSSAPQSAPSFGSSSNKQSAPSFGTTSTTHSTPTFGASSQPTPPFGTTSTTQTTAFGLSSPQSTTVFGAPTSTQSPVRFGVPTTQNTTTTFGPSPGFSTAPSTQPTTAFGAASAASTPAFPSSQSFDNKPITSQTPSLFSHSPAPSFSSNTTFTPNQSNIFAQKPATDAPVFGQNKLQPSGFGSPSQPFASQNKFSFGMSTSNGTGFTTSPPNTTAPPVFSFGGTSTNSNAFAFGSNPSTSNNAQAPFAFKSSANEPFKFGAATTTATTTTTTTTKEGNAFGGTAPATFSFGGQMNNNPVQEQKPSFSFGTSQPASSAPGFSFGSPAPSVFNFGGSTSSASSSSSFNFGTPTPGVPFGQTPSPGVPFAVPGTFNIGSGSSQSRPRASSRPRRRP